MLSARKKPIARGRRGTTLQEMLVVLAILVSLVGSGWPAISGGLGKSQLRSGAKQLRTELAKARLTAIEQGVPYQFRYQAGTGRFEIAPVSAHNGDVDSHAAQAAVAEELPISELELPEGVVFSAKTDDEEQDFSAAGLEDTVAVESEGELSEFVDEDWSAAVVFFPNGRTTNAQVTLQNEDGHHIMVTLRGLTGSATVGDLKKVEVKE